MNRLPTQIGGVLPFSTSTTQTEKIQELIREYLLTHNDLTLEEDRLRPDVIISAIDPRVNTVLQNKVFNVTVDVLQRTTQYFYDEGDSSNNLYSIFSNISVTHNGQTDSALAGVYVNLGLTSAGREDVPVTFDYCVEARLLVNNTNTKIVPTIVFSTFDWVEIPTPETDDPSLLSNTIIGHTAHSHTRKPVFNRLPLIDPMLYNSSQIQFDYDMITIEYARNYNTQFSSYNLGMVWVGHPQPTYAHVMDFPQEVPIFSSSHNRVVQFEHGDNTWWQEGPDDGAGYRHLQVISKGSYFVYASIMYLNTHGENPYVDLYFGTNRINMRRIREASSGFLMGIHEKTDETPENVYMLCDRRGATSQCTRTGENMFIWKFRHFE